MLDLLKAVGEVFGTRVHVPTALSADDYTCEVDLRKGNGEAAGKFKRVGGWKWAACVVGSQSAPPRTI